MGPVRVQEVQRVTLPRIQEELIDEEWSERQDNVQQNKKERRR